MNSFSPTISTARLPFHISSSTEKNNNNYHKATKFFRIIKASDKKQKQNIRQTKHTLWYLLKTRRCQISFHNFFFVGGVNKESNSDMLWVDGIAESNPLQTIGRLPKPESIILCNIDVTE